VCILRESKRWVRETVAWAFRSLLVQDKDLRVARATKEALPAMDLLRIVRDSAAPTVEIVSTFERFAGDWLRTQIVLVRDAIQKNLESPPQARDRFDERQTPVRWFVAPDQLTLRPPGLELVIAAHALEVTALSFSTRSDRLLTGSLDGSVGVWDIESSKLLCRAVPHCGSRVSDAAFSPDGRLIAAAAGAVVVLYDNSLERVVRTFRHACVVEELRWAPDSASILTLANEVLRRWNVDKASVDWEDGWTSRNLSHYTLSPGGLVALAELDYWFDASVGVECGRTQRLVIDGSEVFQNELPNWRSDEAHERVDVLCHDFPLAFVDDATLIALFDPPLCEQFIKSRTWRKIGGSWVENSDEEWVVGESFAGVGQVGRNEAGDLLLAGVSWEDDGQAIFRIHPLTRESRVPTLIFGQEVGARFSGARIAISPDGRRFATTTTIGSVAIWDLGSLLKAASAG
jgi:WD40 repeat protein